MQVERPIVSDGGTGDQSDVLEKVKQLCSLSAPCDSHPNIHAAPQVLNYISDINSRFCDRNAFSFAMAKYLEEGAEQAEMVISCNFFSLVSCVLCLLVRLITWIVVIWTIAWLLSCAGTMNYTIKWWTFVMEELFLYLPWIKDNYDIHSDTLFMQYY